MKDDPEKPFNAALEQVATLLREQVKWKERTTRVLPSSDFHVSLKNAIAQVAQLLRREIQKPLKKRSWKSLSKRKKK